MTNEWLFLLSTIFDISFVFFAARRGSDWLFATIAANLILVSVLGAKLVQVGGLTTNAGNIFYACVFLATHFILEAKDKRTGMKTIWFGGAFIIFFAIMSQLTTRFVGLPLSNETNAAIHALFSASLRITFASITAYVFAQYCNIFLYEWFKAQTSGKYLWLRSNAANVASQLVDSLIFFSLAFSDIPAPLLLQAILVGWLFKSFVVLMGTPFLYADTLMNKTER